MAFINFINAGGGGDPEAEAKLSAMTQDFTSTIERTVSSLTIPSGVTSIGENAFASCSALTEVVIPASVTSIEANAFAENRSLSAITFEGTTPPTLEDGAFSQLPNDVTVNVPSGATDAYSAVTEDIEDSTAFIVEYTDLSGNTTVWYSKYSSVTYSDASNPQPTVPEAGWAKIETKGVKTIDDNAMLFEPATEYVFDEALKNWYCTPLRGNTYPSASQPTKVTFKSTSYDYFDGRIAEACTGLSSITFYCTEAPLMNTEYISSADTAAVGELLVPNAAHNYGIYKERICGEDWVIKDLSGRTMGTVTITTGNGDETYNYYNAPYNAAFVFRTDIIKAKIEGFSDSGGQLFQGCTNLSSVTIDGHIRLEGNIFYDCSNLTEITWLNETSPSVDGSGQFDGVPSAGTMYVNAGTQQTWQSFRDTYLSGWTINEMGGGGSGTFDLVNNCANYGSGKTDILDFYIPLSSSATPSLDFVFGSAVGADGLTTELRKGNGGITFDYVPNQDDALKSGEFIYDITQHSWLYSDSSVYENYPDADAEADLQTLGLFTWQEQEINGETYLLISLNSGECYATMADLIEWGLYDEEIGEGPDVVDANNDIYTYYQ